MRIILITLSTPTYNNVRSASALPYHLIMGAKEQGDIDFEVYSYNINEIDAAELPRQSVHWVSKFIYCKDRGG